MTPTIRRDLPRRLPRLWLQARRNLETSLRLCGETLAAEALPSDCPYG